jgi:hypothetical protein
MSEQDQQEALIAYLLHLASRISDLEEQVESLTHHWHQGMSQPFMRARQSEHDTQPLEEQGAIADF